MGHFTSYNGAVVYSAVEEKVAVRLLLIAATKTHRAQSGTLLMKTFVARNACSVSSSSTNHEKVIFGVAVVE